MIDLLIGPNFADSPPVYRESMSAYVIFVNREDKRATDCEAGCRTTVERSAEIGVCQSGCELPRRAGTGGRGRGPLAAFVVVVSTLPTSVSAYSCRRRSVGTTTGRDGAADEAAATSTQPPPTNRHCDRPHHG